MSIAPARQIKIAEIPQTGIAEIDLQHARLVNLYNRLSEWIERGHDVAATFDAIGDLESYIAEHFSFEEQLQEKIGYPGRARHHALHQEILEEFGRHAKAVLDGEDVADQLLDFIGHWIRTHIAREDMQYARHYLDVRNGLRGGECP